MKANKIILLGLLSLTLVFSSCDKDEVVDHPITTAEVVIGAINKFKPSTIGVIEGGKIYKYDNYTIENGYWLSVEITDQQSIIYRSWDLNKVYSYDYYGINNTIELTFK